MKTLKDLIGEPWFDGWCAAMVAAAEEVKPTHPPRARLTCRLTSDEQRQILNRAADIVNSRADR